jgi:hypothetical protein
MAFRQAMASVSQASVGPDDVSVVVWSCRGSFFLKSMDGFLISIFVVANYGPFRRRIAQWNYDNFATWLFDLIRGCAGDWQGEGAPSRRSGGKRPEMSA